MRWADLELDAPRLGEVCRQRLIAPGVLLVVTARHDGAPRLSPVEPLLLDGDLWLSMMWHSRKAAHLVRDDRILVHSIVTSREGDSGEVKLRGRAIPVDDTDQRRRYSEAVSILGWRPEEPYFHLFRIDISDVSLIRYHPTVTSRLPAGPLVSSSCGARCRRPASASPNPGPTCLPTTTHQVRAPTPERSKVQRLPRQHAECGVSDVCRRPSDRPPGLVLSATRRRDVRRTRRSGAPLRALSEESRLY